MLLDARRCAANAGKLLGVIKLCYEYAYLEGRQQLGLLLSTSQTARLAALRQLLETPGARRQHRRMPTAIPVLLRTPAGQRRGVLLNVSGGGMFVATDDPVACGEPVQVRLGDQVVYSFPCEVRWNATGGGPRGLGLRISGIPVELRASTSRAVA